MSTHVALQRTDSQRTLYLEPDFTSQQLLLHQAQPINPPYHPVNPHQNPMGSPPYAHQSYLAQTYPAHTPLPALTPTQQTVLARQQAQISAPQHGLNNPIKVQQPTYTGLSAVYHGIRDRIFTPPAPTKTAYETSATLTTNLHNVSQSTTNQEIPLIVQSIQIAQARADHLVDTLNTQFTSLSADDKTKILEDIAILQTHLKPLREKLAQLSPEIAANLLADSMMRNPNTGNATAHERVHVSNHDNGAVTRQMLLILLSELIELYRNQGIDAVNQQLAKTGLSTQHQDFLLQALSTPEFGFNLQHGIFNDPNIEQQLLPTLSQRLTQELNQQQQTAGKPPQPPTGDDIPQLLGLLGVNTRIGVITPAPIGTKPFADMLENTEKLIMLQNKDPQHLTGYDQQQIQQLQASPNFMNVAQPNFKSTAQHATQQGPTSTCLLRHVYGENAAHRYDKSADVMELWLPKLPNGGGVEVNSLAPSDKAQLKLDAKQSRNMRALYTDLHSAQSYQNAATQAIRQAQAGLAPQQQGQPPVAPTAQQLQQIDQNLQSAQQALKHANTAKQTMLTQQPNLDLTQAEQRYQQLTTYQQRLTQAYQQLMANPVVLTQSLASIDTTLQSLNTTLSRIAFTESNLGWINQQLTAIQAELTSVGATLQQHPAPAANAPDPLAQQRGQHQQLSGQYQTLNTTHQQFMTAYNSAEAQWKSGDYQGAKTTLQPFLPPQQSQAPLTYYQEYAQFLVQQCDQKIAQQQPTLVRQPTVLQQPQPQLTQPFTPPKISTLLENAQYFVAKAQQILISAATTFQTDQLVSVDSSLKLAQDTLTKIQPATPQSRHLQQQITEQLTDNNTLLQQDHEIKAAAAQLPHNPTIAKQIADRVEAHLELNQMVHFSSYPYHQSYAAHLIQQAKAIAQTASSARPLSQGNPFVQHQLAEDEDAVAHVPDGILDYSALFGLNESSTDGNVATFGHGEA